MKEGLRLFLFLAATGAFFLYVNGQALNPNSRYCYQFTWLGMNFDNNSFEEVSNATCDDVTQLASGIPCKHPLVVTENGTYPDLDYMWENHDSQITCLLIDSEVCATYTYRFGGSIQNVTFMCTKVVTDNDVSLTSGCYKQVSGNRETEVCICRSNRGGRPCNSAARNITSISVIIFMVLFLRWDQIMHFMSNR